MAADAIYGAYQYTGASKWDESIDLGGPREVTLHRKGSQVKNALNQGTVVVTVPMSSSKWSVHCDCILKLFDRDGNVAQVTQTLAFSHNPTQQSFTVPVPLDEGFDIYNIERLTIEDAVKYRQYLYLYPRGDVTVDANWVIPGQVKEPTRVYCLPDSVNSGYSTLYWDGAAAGDFNPITGFEVYRSTSETGSYSKISGDEPLAPTVTRLVVQAQEKRDKAYFYRIKVLGLRKGFDSDRSTAFATLTTEWSEPEAPAQLTLSATLVKPGQTVTLSWARAIPGTNNPAVRYEVYRQEDVFDYELIATTSGTSVTVDPPPSNAVTYRFKVKAIGLVEGFDSPLSAASAGLRATFTAPSVPRNLQIDNAQSIYLDPGERATLTWTGSTDGLDNPLIGYRVYQNDEEIAFVTETTYSVAAAQAAGETLRLYVRAAGQWSNSQPSNVVELTTTLPPVPPRSNDAITQFLHFDRHDELLFVRDDAISMRVTEEEYRLNGAFPYQAEKSLEPGMRIGWLEGEELRMYEIRQPETDLNTLEQSFEAEHAAIAELSDMVIEATTFMQQTATAVVGTLLQGTGWRLGHVTAPSDVGDVEMEYTSVWAALIAVRDAWSIEVVPRMAYTYDGIERYIDLLERRGENRGVRLTLDLNVQSAGIIYDDRSQYTALYGFGENINETDEAGNKTSRRIGFDGVAWSVEDGRPVDKPLGQKYIEDPEATALYGRKGRPRYGMMTFDGVTNPQILLKATWDALQQLKTPKFTISMTAFNLATIGYAAQGIALGDDVVVILDPIGVEVMARVTKFDRDVLRPENSKPTIGDVRETILGKIAAATKQQITVGGGYTLDVDNTLTIEGMAADAKTVGEKLAERVPVDMGTNMAKRYLVTNEEGKVVAAAVRPAEKPMVYTSLPAYTTEDDVGRLILVHTENPTRYMLAIGLRDAYGEIGWGIIANEINF